MRESPSTWHPDVINRFVFRDLQDTYSYGTVTNIAINNGVAVFNGASSKLEFNSVYHSNVYSIRLKINSLNSLTQDICKLSSTMGVSINSGTIIATGFSSPRIYVNGKLSSSITATGGDVFIVQDTPFIINSFVLGYNTSYFSGSIDLVEFYNEPLVEGMCDAIYTGRYFKEHPADMRLIKQMKQKGYIWVPGNSLYPGCEKGFWVAKYQAKASKTGVNGRGLNVADFPAMTGTYNTWYYNEDSNVTIVSTPEGSPITNISQLEAIAACAAVGGHLITNNEWMTLVRNIEQVPSNWSSGTIGEGYLPRGNSFSSGAMDGFTDITGWTKRTLTLTNGEVIWDLAGNVREWTNDNIDMSVNRPKSFNENGDEITTDGFYNYSFKASDPSAKGYIKYDDLGNTTLKYKDLFLLTSGNYNVDNGIGRMYLSRSTNIVFLRGGFWSFSSNSGLLALILCHSSTALDGYFGLRCAVVP